MMMKSFMKFSFRWARRNKQMIEHHLRQRQAYRSRPPQFFKNFPDAVFEEAKCGFVLSTGRCGTGLLTRILGKSQNVDVYHAPMPELKIASKRAYEREFESIDAYKDLVVAARYELIMASYICDRVFVETNNRISFFARYLADVFKNSVFLHIVRHPADFVRSAIRRGYYEDPQVSSGLIVPLPGSLDVDWEKLTPIERAAWLWNETNASIEVFAKTISSNRFLRVKAEDTFENVSTIAQVLQFLRAEQLSEKKIRQLIRHPVNAQEIGHFPKYTHWTTQQKRLLSVFTPLAASYDYKL
jgi:hypothetical protein